VELWDGSGEATAAKPLGHGVVAGANLRVSVGEECGFQFGFARKPLKTPDSQKEEARILLPSALIFLPPDLDFPPDVFDDPSPDLDKS
jgi:hypothetical protein